MIAQWYNCTLVAQVVLSWMPLPLMVVAFAKRLASLASMVSYCRSEEVGVAAASRLPLATSPSWLWNAHCHVMKLQAMKAVAPFLLFLSWPLSVHPVGIFYALWPVVPVLSIAFRVLPFAAALLAPFWLVSEPSRPSRPVARWLTRREM